MTETVFTEESTRVINVTRMGPRGGTPVVFIHPAGLELSYWDRQFAALGEDHDLIAFDLPGHGQTVGDPQDWTVENIVEFIAGVVATTGFDRVHLVGVSLGGMLALAFTQIYPDRVQSLSAMDAAASFTDGARSAMRVRATAAREAGMSAVVPSLTEPWFAPATLVRRPDLLDRAQKTLLGDDPLVHAAMWDMIADFDISGDLHRISCPTMVLVGEADTVTPLPVAQGLRDCIEGAELRVVANAAHMPQLEQAAMVNQHLLSFFSASA